MGATLKVVAPVALGSSIGDIYTVSTGKNSVVKSIVICNTDTSDRSVYLYAVPSGGSAAVANMIFADTVKTMETKVIGPDIFLEAGAKVRGYASAASVVGCRVSALEVA
jgi:hypothetical protein